MSTIKARAALASGPDTAEATLRELGQDKSVKVRVAVAGNPGAPADLLTALVEDPRWEVRHAAAENPHRAARTAALASRDPLTRAVASRRADLNTDDLRALANDPDPRVRTQLALVCRDEVTLAALARDAVPSVRESTLHNEALRLDDVEMLASDPIARVRAVAASSRRLRAGTLTRLAHDRSSQVRWSVLLFNPERLDLAAVIAQDSNESNAHQARAQLKDPREFTGFLGPIDLVR